MVQNPLQVEDGVEGMHCHWYRDLSQNPLQPQAGFEGIIELEAYVREMWREAPCKRTLKLRGSNNHL